MQMILPIDEALAIATAVKPPPALLRSVTSAGAQLQLEVDLRQIPNPGTALRLAAAAVGTVTATLTFTGYDSGVATFQFSAQARGLPAHKIANHLTGPINSALTDCGLPEGLVEVRKGTGDPVLAIRVQDAVDARITGLTVTDFDLRGAAIFLGATITGGVQRVS